MYKSTCRLRYKRTKDVFEVQSPLHKNVNKMISCLVCAEFIAPSRKSQLEYKDRNVKKVITHTL